MQTNPVQRMQRPVRKQHDLERSKRDQAAEQRRENVRNARWLRAERRWENA